MKRVVHKFANKDFYEPYWFIKTLFLGTFNPEGDGKELTYYYGREKNQFWSLLRELKGVTFNLEKPKEFFKELKELGIGCMDVIHALDVPENKLKNVLGKGYSDSNIINTCVDREYNITAINKVIEKNSGVKVFTTWGKGPRLKEFRNEVYKLKIEPIPLVSPSMAARVDKNVNKFEYMLNDWKKINDL